MNNSTNYIIVFLLLLCAAGLQGQNAQLKGVVKTADGTPVPYATVQLHQAADTAFLKGAIADDQGAFVLAQLAEGTYLLNSSSVGLEDAALQQIELAKDQQLDVGVIQMNVSAQMLDEVVVKSLRPILEQKPDMTVLNLDNMQTQGKNSLDVLRFGPGVLVDFTGNVSLNNRQGVVIMINGKPSELVGEDLAMFLRSIPANSIKKIEIISNPSARYDAQGTGGIINIVMKRDQSLGTKVYVEQNFEYGVNDRWNSSIRFDHRWEKINLYGDYHYSIGDWESINRGERFATTNGEEILFDQNSVKVQNWKSPNYQFGGDYFIDDRQTVGVLVRGFRSDSEGLTNAVSDIRNASGDIDSVLTTRLFNPHDRSFDLFNVNYKYQDTSGNEFNIDFDYGRFDYRQQNDLDNELERFDGGPKSLFGQYSDADTDIRGYSVKADWKKPINRIFTLEAGAKATILGTDNHFDSFRKNYPENEMITDSLQTNTFEYDERVLAAYANFILQYKKFGFQFGLRGEQTNVEGLSTDLFGNRIRKPDSTYFNLFPSAFLTYRLSDMHKLRLSYSKRIARPYYGDLNPFVFYNDAFTVTEGNPFLIPEFTDSYELSYTYQDAATLSFSYSNTDNLIRSISTQNEEVITTRSINIGELNSYNINLSGPTPINNWWRGYLWIGAFANQYGGVVDNEQLNYTQIGVNGFISQNFTVKDWNIEVSAWYNSPSQDIIFRNASNGAVNFGIGRSILKDKGYLKVRVNDIFKTQRNASEANFSSVRMNNFSTFESRSVNISFNYN
ncbi:MAG: TonB-dependent receptor, partial [Bacteroidota bacterium]